MLSYRIKLARTKIGWNQAEFASRLSKSRTAIVNWETGYSKPDMDTVQKIADMLNVDKDWLLDTSNDELELKQIEKSIDSDDGVDWSFNQKLGAKLRYYRKRKGLTQEKAAELLITRNSSLSGYEIGRNQPHLEMLINMAELYNMSIDDLLDINSDNAIKYESWILEILSSTADKQEALKKIWDSIKSL